jgi:site-specific DNA-methyltransferase (adenine-specific)
MTVRELGIGVRLVHGDALDVLRGVPDASIDAVVTDPPAGIAFMSRAWDDFGTEAREAFVGFLAEILRECLRVLRPGGHALVWAIPRTSHWTGWAVEQAGFEIRDVVTHLFGSGFPKSLDVSKAIDKAAGAARESAGSADPRSRFDGHARSSVGHSNAFGSITIKGQVTTTLPATDAAKQWNGWGTALKPACELWILARKPFDSTVADNVLRYSTGALNIDGCRIAVVGETVRTPLADPANRVGAVGQAHTYARLPVEEMHRRQQEATERTNTLGRWPPNLVLTHHPDCRKVGTRKVRSGVTVTGGGFRTEYVSGDRKDTEEARRAWGSYNDPDGAETIEAWACAPGCPVAALDAQSGTLTSGEPGFRRKPHATTSMAGSLGGARDVRETGYADKGGASRFFPTFAYEADDFVPFAYAAKAPRSEREDGLRGHVPCHACGGLDSRDHPAPTEAEPDRRAPCIRNAHPTVKPVALMRWLVRLVTPPGGAVLDPFAGSGSTGVAAVREGFRFVGIEREPDYVAIAEARIRHAIAHRPAQAREPLPVQVNQHTVPVPPLPTAASPTSPRSPAMPKTSRPFVQRVTSNIKGGVAAELGWRTLIVGPNGEGKSAIVNALSLCLTGAADDVVGRAVVQGTGPNAWMIGDMAPAGEAVEASAVLSNGVESRYTANRKDDGGIGKPRQVNTFPGAFPLRDVREALTGSADKARQYLLARVADTITEGDVLARLPADEATRAAYAAAVRAAGAASQAPADQLLAVAALAKQRAASFADRAQQLDALVQERSAAMPILPLEADVQAAQAERDAARDALSAAQSRAAVVRALDVQELRRAAQDAVARFRDAKAALPTTPPPAPACDVELATAALTVARFNAARPAEGGCVACGQHASPALFAQYLAGLERDLAAVAAGQAYAAAQRRVESLKADALRAVDALEQAETKLGMAGLTAADAEVAVASAGERVRLAEARLWELERARGAHVEVQGYRSGAEEATAQAAAEAALHAACRAAIEGLLDSALDTFVARVNRYLPTAYRFALTLREKDKAVCRFGFVQEDGRLHTALSGAEWAVLMVALAAACTPPGDGPVVLVPEERAFDPDTLGLVMRALDDAPGQVILTSPIKPSGRMPAGWSVVEVGAATADKPKRTRRKAPSGDAASPDAATPNGSTPLELTSALPLTDPANGHGSTAEGASALDAVPGWAEGL